MVRKTLIGAGLALVLFHAWLLVSQLWDGQLADLALLSRWVVAGGLSWALVHLRRRGHSILVGRRAIAVWLLAALLHGPAVAERLGVLSAPAVPEVVATLSQVALGVLVAGALFLAGLLPAVGRPALSLLNAPGCGRARIGALPPDAYLCFAPRPPPVA